MLRWFLVLLCVWMAPCAIGQKLDVLIDLDGPSETPQKVSKWLAGTGRVLGLDGASGKVRVELSGDFQSKLSLLRERRGAASVEPTPPTPISPETMRRSIKRLRAAIADYKAKYQAFEALHGKVEEGEDEIPGLDYLNAYLYYVEERAYPNDVPDWAALNAASAKRDKMPPARNQSGVGPSSLGAVWTFEGPTGLGVPYTIYWGPPPVAGRINGVATHPSNPGTIFITGAQGGVFRSTDWGQNFQPLSDQWEVMAASAIAIDPGDPNAIFVGTGDYAGFRPYCMGIMRSLDGGNTWQNFGRSHLGSRAIRKILHLGGGIVLATQGRGASGNGAIWRSTSNGVSWTAVVGTASWSDLSQGLPRPGGPGYIYAAGGTSTNAVLRRSSTNGATWAATAPLPIPNGPQEGVCIAASRVDPETVYVLCPSVKKIFKSTNAGALWVDITAGFPNGPGDYNWSQGWYDFHLEVGQQNGMDVVYVGLIDLVASYDGGTTWQSIGGPTYSNNALIHNDQHALHIVNDFEALVAGDGGLYRLMSIPGNPTYTNLNSNIGIAQFYRISTRLGAIMGGLQDNATAYSPVTQLPVPFWQAMGGGDGGYCTSTGMYHYLTAQFLRVYQGLGGGPFTDITPPYGSDSIAFIAPMTARRPPYLLTGTDYLYSWDEWSSSWNSRLGGQKLSTSGNLRAIDAGLGPSARFYTGSSDGELWMSVDAGVTWIRIDSGVGGSLPNRTITSIESSPMNENDVVVTLSGTGSDHVYRCIDTMSPNRTWVALDGPSSSSSSLPDVPVNRVFRSIQWPGNVYFVATDVGVFVTETGGTTWYNLTQPKGLPNTQVNDLDYAFDNTGNMRLVAGTFGRGMWSLPMSPLNSLNGAIIWDRYLSGTTKPLLVEVCAPGGGAPLFSSTVNVPGPNTQPYLASFPFQGSCDLRYSVPGFLRRRVSNQFLSIFGTTVNVFLINGDITNDNRIDSDDFDALVAAFGSPGPIGDLDGVNGVDSDDFDILVSRFGMIGDD